MQGGEQALSLVVLALETGEHEGEEGLVVGERGSGWVAWGGRRGVLRGAGGLLAATAGCVA